MVVTFDTIHFETSLLNWFAAKNTEFIQRQKTQKKQINTRGNSKTIRKNVSFILYIINKRKMIEQYKKGKEEELILYVL